jgi:hypothetical protein
VDLSGGTILANVRSVGVNRQCHHGSTGGEHELIAAMKVFMAGSVSRPPPTACESPECRSCNADSERPQPRESTPVNSTHAPSRETRFAYFCASPYFPYMAVYILFTSPASFEKVGRDWGRVATLPAAGTGRFTLSIARSPAA